MRSAQGPPRCQGIIATLTLLLLASKAVLASTWISQPYAVQLWYAPQQVADVLAICDERFAEGVELTLQAVIGRAWSIKSQTIISDGLFLGDGSAQASFQDAFEFDRETINADKIFLVGIAAGRSGYEVQIRELDCQVQTWGAPLRFSVSQPQALAGRVAQGILSTFRPIAKIGRVRQGEAVLEPRAGILATESSPLFPGIGRVMQPIVCKVNSSADGVSKDVQPVPWTALVVKSIAEDRIIGQLVSGLRALCAPEAADG